MIRITETSALTLRYNNAGGLLRPDTSCSTEGPGSTELSRPGDKHVRPNTCQGDNYCTENTLFTSASASSHPYKVVNEMPGQLDALNQTLDIRRTPRWRNKIETVMVDRFTSLKMPPKELPGETELMGPFTLLRLIIDAMDRCRQRTELGAYGQRDGNLHPRARKLGQFRAVLHRRWYVHGYELSVAYPGN